jgi:hypothetical protein
MDKRDTVTDEDRRAGPWGAPQDNGLTRVARWLWPVVLFVSLGLMHAQPGQFGTGLFGQVNDEAVAALHKYVTY